MPYKVAIIGAARRQQGTGPYVAKYFASLGLNIVGILGTTSATALNAKEQLQQQYDIDAQAYTNFVDLYSQQKPDIVAICSPPETHLDYIEQALKNNCHVFCEKPLWWPSEKLSSSDYITKIRHVLSLAEQQNLIHLNTQWPYTLRYFGHLYPASSLAPDSINSFTMFLSPESKDAQMLTDSVSHGLSMLHHLLAAGEITNIQFTCSGNPVDIIDLHFDYQHIQGTTHCVFLLQHSLDLPKPAWYQINNLRVERQVALPDYQIQLQSPTTTCSIIDPLLLSVKDFVAAIDAKITSDCDTALLSAKQMHMLIQAYLQR